MKKKPTKKQIDDDLKHLRHLETCIFPILISFMFATLTLSNTFQGISDLRKFFELMIIFLFFLSINHLYWIAMRDIEKRVNAFMWDIGFFLFVLIVYPTAIFSRVFVEDLDMNLASNEGFLLSFGIYFIITIVSIIIVSELITKKVIPAFRDKIFPSISYNKKIINPFHKDTYK